MVQLKKSRSDSSLARISKRAKDISINSIEISGYKSLYDGANVAIRPLTILAGANSSGKSSVMQPLLLLKQTLEAPYDPGPLLLNGPHVRFTAASQLFSRIPGRPETTEMAFAIHGSDGSMLRLRFEKQPKAGLDVVESAWLDSKGKQPVVLRRSMSHQEIIEHIELEFGKSHQLARNARSATHLGITRERCSLAIEYDHPESGSAETAGYMLVRQEPILKLLRSIIHVPALRGNPERTYKTTAFGAQFPGVFDPYVASLINHWQQTDKHAVALLGQMLAQLGLTTAIAAARIDDTQIELRVGRLKTGRKNARDLINIADVGFGISQVLPVLVALLAAEPGQLVYIEQPEIHLHPRAQWELACILAFAVQAADVRIVVETHSAVLLRGIQYQVAVGKFISPQHVALHWFSQTEDGATRLSTADLDEAGAFGDWPEDFDEVSLDVESQYLDAAEQRLAERTVVQRKGR